MKAEESCTGLQSYVWKCDGASPLANRAKVEWCYEMKCKETGWEDISCIRPIYDKNQCKEFVKQDRSSWFAKDLLASLKTVGFQCLSPFMGSPMDKQFPAAEVLIGRMLYTNGPVYCTYRNDTLYFSFFKCSPANSWHGTQFSTFPPKIQRFLFI